MLKKITIFSFVTSLVLLIITVISGTVVIKDGFNKILNLKGSFIEHRMETIKIDKNIDEIVLFSEIPTYVKFEVGNTKTDDEIHISYTSFFGNEKKLDFETSEDDELIITQSLVKNDDLGGVSLVLTNEFISANSITIMIPENIDYRVAGDVENYWEFDIENN